MYLLARSRQPNNKYLLISIWDVSPIIRGTRTRRIFFIDSSKYINAHVPSTKCCSFETKTWSLLMECHRTHEAKQIPMRLTLCVRWQYCPSPQSFFEKCNFPYKEMSQAFTRRHCLIRRIIKRSRCLGLPHWWVCVPESRSICPSRFLTVVRCFTWILPSQFASPAPPSSPGLFLLTVWWDEGMAPCLWLHCGLTEVT